MNVALDLFAHNGFHNTSVAQIAKNAGISKGLIYNYFESKEELLQQIFIDTFVQTNELVSKEIQNNIEPKVQLENIITLTFKNVRENLEFYKLMTAIAFQGDILLDMKETLKSHARHLDNQLEKIFKNLGYKNYKYEALIFGATLDGLGLQYIHNIDQHPIEEIKQFLIHKYCH
jgi:AcrR family transcriptional regulator